MFLDLTLRWDRRQTARWEVLYKPPVDEKNRDLGGGIRSGE